MVVNDKNGISSYEMARALGVTQKTAWFLDHRIRLAMQDGTIEKLSGKVEADETAIGGLSKNMHKNRRARVIHSTGKADKTIAMGILERGGKVRAMVIPNVSRKVLHGEINQNVEQGSEVFTDAWHCYQGLDPEYVHQVIDHAVAYVNGQVHTNGIENFWSLLKCHSSPYNRPSVFTHTRPSVFTHTRPSVFTHTRPVVFTHARPLVFTQTRPEWTVSLSLPN
jgi:transposase-like protein